MTARRLVLLALNVVPVALLAAMWHDEPRRDGQLSANVPMARSPDRGAHLRVMTEPVPAKLLFRLPKPVAATVPDEPPPVANPQPSFRLVGVVWGEAEGIALVQGVEEGPHRRARVGDTVDGWQLTGVTARSATFQLDERTVLLDLLRHRSSATSDPR